MENLQAKWHEMNRILLFFKFPLRQMGQVNSFIKENRTVLFCLLLFYIAWKIFYPCLGNDFVNYDDQEYVYENSNVTSGLNLHSLLWAFSSTTSGNWHPLTMLSHIIDWQLYGDRAWGHHLLNVVLHCFNGVLLFLLLREGTGSVGKSFAVALLFSLHPLRVESVAWVSERKDVLSTFFLMLTMLFYIRYVFQAKSNGEKTRLYYVLAVLFFIAGLMSKVMLVTLPCTLLLLDIWPLRRWERQAVMGLFKEKILFFILAAIFSIITISSQNSAIFSMEALPLVRRLENVPMGYYGYLQKLFCPDNLAVFYPYLIRCPMMPLIVSSLSLIVISTAVALWHGGRRYMLVGWLWFLGTLFPVIGLIQTGRQSMADRYSYVPSIGIFIMVVWGAAEAAKRWKISTAVSWAAVIAVAVTCGALTRKQITYWKNGESLFRHAAAVTENNYVAYAMIGVFEAKHLKYNAAIASFHRALQIRPVEVKIQLWLAAAYIKNGQFDDAIKTLQTSIALEPANAFIHKEIATALISKGCPAEARTNLLIALKIKPDYLEAQNELRKLAN